jgi:hypothetical protein
MNNIKCPTHGDIPQNQWGCPECVKELREENIKLKRLLNKPPKKKLVVYSGCSQPCFS